MCPPAQLSAVAPAPGRELVLVVPRGLAIPEGSWHGLRLEGLPELLRQIELAGEFRARSEVEDQPEWQQIIPHLVVVAGPTVLAMRRLQAGSERRLRGQITLGVGGHVNVADGAPAEAWIRGSQREWTEEVSCDRAVVGQAVGLIKDDAGAVGRVHLGILMVVEASGCRIAVREEEKLSGEMLSLEALGSSYLQMETWSQFVFDALVDGRLTGATQGIPVALPPTDRSSAGVVDCRP